MLRLKPIRFDSIPSLFVVGDSLKSNGLIQQLEQSSDLSLLFQFQL